MFTARPFPSKTAMQAGPRSISLHFDHVSKKKPELSGLQCLCWAQVAPALFIPCNSPRAICQHIHLKPFKKTCAALQALKTKSKPGEFHARIPAAGCPVGHLGKASLAHHTPGSKHAPNCTRQVYKGAPCLRLHLTPNLNGIELVSSPRRNTTP